MSLAALGCNPNQSEADLADMGGLALGTLAFSPDGGIYTLIKADGAISAGAVCLIKGDWEADEITTALGAETHTLCVPQVAIANNAYGWGLVWGNGMVEAAASCGASAHLSTTDTAGRLDDADTAGRVNGIQLKTARPASAGLAPAYVAWPKIDILA